MPPRISDARARRAPVTLVALVMFSAAWLALRAAVGAPTGLERTVFAQPGFAGAVIDRANDSRIDLTFLDDDRHLPRRDISVRWSGVWLVPKEGAWRVRAAADDRVKVLIDGREAVARSIASGSGVSQPIHLTRGFHSITVDYEQERGGAFLRVLAAARDERPAPLESDALFPALPAAGAPLRNVVLRWTGRALGLAWVIAGFFLIIAERARGPRVWQAVRTLHVWRPASAGPSRSDARARTAMRRLAVCAIVLLAVSLRIDALLARYGPLERPRWAEELQIHWAAPLASLRPSGFGWSRDARPYEGGDPINYLRRGREMRHFYEANGLEPVFPYATRLWLAATDGQNVAVSFASATFSVFAVLFTYLLGAAAYSPGVGILSAFFMAIERDVIGWSVEGWRDEAFAAGVVLTTYASVRCARWAGRGDAVFAGASAAFACLTRITSLTFVVPAFVALAFWPRGDGVTPASGPRLKPGATAIGAALLAAALIAPFLINCARAYGDPLYVVNYHTKFYGAREGQSQASSPGDRTMAEYLGAKLLRQPIRSAHVAIVGLTSYPFLNKWGGFRSWAPGVGVVLAVFALAGLCLMARDRNGQLLLLVLFTSLAPYMLTWPIRGGAEWRFTMHAYPFYLIAAALALDRGFRGLAARFSRAAVVPAFRRGLVSAVVPAFRRGLVSAVVPAFRRGLVALAAAAALWGLAWFLPRLEAREALAARAIATVRPEDSIFFIEGWSPPLRSGDVRVRFAVAPRAALALPLPKRRGYVVRIRLDPFENTPGGQSVRVLVNGVFAGVMAATTNEATIQIPAAAVRAGMNRLEFVSAEIVPARVLRSRAQGLAEDQAAAFRLWEIAIE